MRPHQTQESTAGRKASLPFLLGSEKAQVNVLGLPNKLVLKCVTKKIPSLSYCRSDAPSLHLSECLSPSLIRALYIDLGNMRSQNTTHLHRQASYQSQFLYLATSTHFGGVKSTDRLITHTIIYIYIYIYTYYYIYIYIYTHIIIYQNIYIYMYIYIIYSFRVFHIS